MMDNKLEHILDKLRKLLDLKESATQCGELGEANAAAAAITRLLKEYDLTLQDIPNEQKQLDPVDMEVIPYRFSYMKHKWYWVLQTVIAKYNSCQIIRTRTFNEDKLVDIIYKVVGRKQHRKVVLYLISFCAHQFIRIGKSNYESWKFGYIRSTGRIPPSLGIYMKSFLLGCVQGLDEKLEQEQHNFPEEKLKALVVTNKTAIAEFLNNMEVKTAKSKALKVDMDALEEGREVGRNIDLNKGIEDKSDKPSFLQ